MMKKVNTPNVLTYAVESFTGAPAKYITQVYPWGGSACTCPDFVYRRKEVGGECKHLRAIRAEEVRH
jgi:predicted nucleic acid-binding Zn finger protein